MAIDPTPQLPADSLNSNSRAAMWPQCHCVLVKSECPFGFLVVPTRWRFLTDSNRHIAELLATLTATGKNWFYFGIKQRILTQVYNGPRRASSSLPVHYDAARDGGGFYEGHRLFSAFRVPDVDALSGGLCAGGGGLVVRGPGPADVGIEVHRVRGLPRRVSEDPRESGIPANSKPQSASNKHGH